MSSLSSLGQLLGYIYKRDEEIANNFVFNFFVLILKDLIKYLFKMFQHIYFLPLWKTLDFSQKRH